RLPFEPPLRTHDHPVGRVGRKRDAATWRVAIKTSRSRVRIARERAERTPRVAGVVVEKLDGKATARQINQTFVIHFQGNGAEARIRGTIGSKLLGAGGAVADRLRLVSKEPGRINNCDLAVGLTRAK